MGLWGLFRKYPHWVLFITAATFLWVAVVNANNSERIESEGYREIEAEICNAEAVQVLWHRRYVTRYNYDVVWYADGAEYVKHMREEFDGMPEGTRTIWVSEDNQKVVLYSPENIMQESNKDVLIAALAGIGGVVVLLVRKRGK